MNGTGAGQTRLVIVGATGMVGGYALRYALDRPSVGVVTVIGRRKLGISPLKEVFHRDFADCSNGTQLRNCPPYVREWVTRERTEMHGRLSERGLERREDIEDA